MRRSDLLASRAHSRHCPADRWRVSGAAREMARKTFRSRLDTRQVQRRLALLPDWTVPPSGGHVPAGRQRTEKLTGLRTQRLEALDRADPELAPAGRAQRAVTTDHALDVIESRYGALRSPRSTVHGPG
jgi:hypothetical protein